MKLNYKRTIFVGFAFFLICTFWQAYDTIIPKILTDKFGMSQAASGGVMALDNVLAIFLLPLFGAISDKTNTKLGRRTPFIIAGTLAAAIAFVGLSFVDNAQARALNGVEKFETAVYGTIADADAQNDDIKGIFDNAVSTVFNNCLNKKLITPNGVEFVVMNEFAIPGDNDQSETEKMISVRDYLAGEAEQTALNAASVAVDREFFCAIENYYSPVDVDNTDNRLVQPSRLYSEFYVPARQAYAEDISSAGAVRTGLFIAVLLVVLISMALFRSPAVALMPDVTIKPLRSKANAVINLMGTAGGIIVLALGMIFGTGAHASTQMCMAALESILRGGEYVVDLGCGSGILSIAALRLGAARAVGVDIDPLAPAVAAENAARNQMGPDCFTALAGDVLSDPALIATLSPCDVLLANIVADVIIPLSPIAAGMLRPGGTFLCSGILDRREDEVAEAITRAGFQITARAAQGDWRCLTAILPGAQP